MRLILKTKYLTYPVRNWSSDAGAGKEGSEEGNEEGLYVRPSHIPPQNTL
jgi:hypothetical protein